MTGLTAARLSFTDSSKLLKDLAGLTIEPKQVERSAEALGRAIAEDDVMRGRGRTGIANIPKLLAGYGLTDVLGA